MTRRERIAARLWEALLFLILAGFVALGLWGSTP